MNNKERSFILQIYNDCLELENRNELTEFGKGQLVICRLLLDCSLKKIDLGDKKYDELSVTLPIKKRLKFARKLFR